MIDKSILPLLFEHFLTELMSEKFQTNIKVKITKLKNGINLPIPEYKTQGASGVDLYAAIDEHNGFDGSIFLSKNTYKEIPTGIALEIPKGYEAQIRPRSGWSKDYGISVLNSPGTIDSDYRGELIILLINLGEKTVEIKRGDRIAQLVFAPVVKADIIEVDTLESSLRGEKGFGSTGFELDVLKKTESSNQ